MKKLSSKQRKRHRSILLRRQNRLKHKNSRERLSSEKFSRGGAIGKFVEAKKSRGKIVNVTLLAPQEMCVRKNYGEVAEFFINFRECCATMRNPLRIPRHPDTHSTNIRTPI
ncbi:hypothetical protein, partial [uncultured Rhodospira sp.]|uniref:hypothetical protein n=1 Tax=uncultured Rhodospira sp. TaxID=1936189 RepID=UPI00262FDD9D